MLSALAGGGLTAAGLGGPLAGWALAATTPAGTPNAAEGSSEAPVAESAPGAEPGQSSTTTSTTPAASSTPSETPAAPSTIEPSTTPAQTQSTTTPQASAPSPSGANVPTVVLKRKQKATASAPANPSQTTTEANSKNGKSSKKTSGKNNVAASPQSVAAEAGLLAALLSSSEASAASLDFYRIPLFLLPIYKAAAVQYGVPWQILAAINEIETDYGSDLSVSTAGAVGWMQFMPSTWLQYGVDALNAGYADPYNPVDAVFAAARYLRAAGASTNLRAAILAYNHSEEYVESVLLRAKLISTYPKAVIATLTGLIDGRLPVTGKQLAWGPLPSASLPASSASAGATASSATAGATEVASASTPGSSASASSAPLSPTAAAAAATSKAATAAAQAPRFVELLSAPNASVVAVQDGRIIKIGESRKLGKYVVLRDVYGDVFTYAGLGSIAPTYTLPKAPDTPAKSAVVEAASTPGPAPSQPASAGIQSPITLSVKTPLAKGKSDYGEVSIQAGAQEPTPAGMGDVRLYAHPDNPDARAAAVASAARKARNNKAGQAQALSVGSVVASGTVLGRVNVPAGAQDGHLRFAVQPAGDSETVNPGPVLANWAQLQTALHPQGAKATDALLGATASDVFLLSKPQLERAVLSDPGITIDDACGRHEIASGMVGRRVLAVLAFLSRSGLQPTVSALRCAQRQYTTSGVPLAAYTGDEVDISAINGTPIAGHQGPETITDLTIRTLLTLPSEFVPREIGSLMRYPGSPNTQASATDSNRIHLEFNPAAPATTTLNPAAAATVAHSARSGRAAPAPVVATSTLNSAQWSQLIERVAALPTPTVAAKPSSAAIPDPKAPITDPKVR
jgi:soluble lytic murein transglycosylase-like protein